MNNCCCTSASATLQLELGTILCPHLLWTSLDVLIWPFAVTKWVVAQLSFHQ